MHEGRIACLVDVDVELLDTLKGELVALDENPHGLVHELAGDLPRLRGQGGGEHAHLQAGWKEWEQE